MLWTQTREARAILASISADPPAQQTFGYRFNETETRYVGERVKRLRVLWRKAEPVVDSPEWQAWLDAEPGRVIAAAVASRSSNRKAA